MNVLSNGSFAKGESYWFDGQPKVVWLAMAFGGKELDRPRTPVHLAPFDSRDGALRSEEDVTLLPFGACDTLLVFDQEFGGEALYIQPVKQSDGYYISHPGIMISRH